MSKTKCVWGCPSFCKAQFPPAQPAVFTCTGCGKRFDIFQESCGCPKAPFQGEPVGSFNNKNWDRNVKLHKDWKQGKFPLNCKWSR